MSDSQERIWNQGTIIAGCIDTIIDTFLQVFFILTLSLMKGIFPWSTIVRWDTKSNPHEIIFRDANFREYEFFFGSNNLESLFQYYPANFS